MDISVLFDSVLEFIFWKSHREKGCEAWWMFFGKDNHVKLNVFWHYTENFSEQVLSIENKDSRYVLLESKRHNGLLLMAYCMHNVI